jgi:hypothetical protein
MSEELKYPHEWFELLKSEIPQPFRFEIGDNLDEEFEDCGKCERFDFISNAFDWDETSHGVKYWCEVEEPFCNGTLQRHADQVNKERLDALKVGDTLYSTTGDGRIGIVTGKYTTEIVVRSGEKNIHNGIEYWFLFWTPIKPKHWEDQKLTENEINEMVAKGNEMAMQNLSKVDSRKALSDINQNDLSWNDDATIQNAINLLKEKGYKILKPTTNYEEI